MSDNKFTFIYVIRKIQNCIIRVEYYINMLIINLLPVSVNDR